MQSTKISSISTRVLQVVQKLCPILEPLADHVRQETGRDDISIAHVYMTLKPYLDDIISGAVKTDKAFIARFVEEVDALDLESELGAVRVGLLH